MNTVTEEHGNKFFDPTEIVCHLTKCGGKAVIIFLVVIFVAHYSFLEWARRFGFQNEWGYDSVEYWDRYFGLNRLVLGWFIHLGYVGASFKTEVVRPFNTLVDIILIRQQVPGSILKLCCDKIYSIYIAVRTVILAPYEKWIPNLDTLAQASLAVQMMAEILSKLFGCTWFVAVVLSIGLLFLIVNYKYAKKKILDEWKWTMLGNGCFSAWMWFTDMCGVPGWICFIMIVPGWYCWDTDGLAGMFLYAIMVFVFGVIACATITRF